MLSIVFHPPARGFAALLRAEKTFLRRALRKTFGMISLPDRKYIVSIVLSDDATVRELNRAFRHKDKPTNVLSFPQFDDIKKLKKALPPVELGDIILAAETVKKEAKEQKKSFRDHTAHLVAHGLLHLAGYDHDTDKNAAKMEKIEIAVMAELGIEDPYL